MLFSSAFQIGFFMEPTVFTDVEDHMYLAKEESFGPIMVISKFPNGYVLRHNLTRLTKYGFFFFPTTVLYTENKIDEHTTSTIIIIDK